MEILNTLLNQFGVEFLFFAFLVIFSLMYLLTSKKQNRALGQVEESLKLQSVCNQQLNMVVNELRRSNRILSMIAEMDSDEEYPADYKESNPVSLQGSGSATKPAQVNTQSGNPLAEGEGFKLYVGNIDYSASENELASYFSQVGLVEFVNIPVNRYTGKARGFGFVTFSSKDDAERAMTLHGSEFRGRQIQVNFAKERDYA